MILNRSNSDSGIESALLKNQVQIKNYKDEFVDLHVSEDDLVLESGNFFQVKCCKIPKHGLGEYLTWSKLKIFFIIVVVLIVVILFAMANEEQPSEGISKNLYGVSRNNSLKFPLEDMTNYVEFELETQYLKDVGFNLTFWVSLLGSNNESSMNWHPLIVLPLEQETRTNLWHKQMFDLTVVNATDLYSFYRIELATDSYASRGVIFKYRVLPNLVKYEVLLAFLILLLLYVVIIFELLHRALAAMLCAFIALGINAQVHARHTFATVVGLIDFETIGLLFGMMIMVGIFSKTGFFEWAGVKAFKYSGGNLWYLCLAMSLLTAFVSSVLDNVTTIMLVTPVTMKICQALDTSPVVMLLAEVIFSNLGGAATIIGDPPNIIIANNQEISKIVNFGNFVAHIAPGVLLAMIGCFFYLWSFRKEFHREPNLALKKNISIWKKTLLEFEFENHNSVHLGGEKVVFESMTSYIQDLERQLENSDNQLSTLTELEEKYQITDVPLLISSSVVLLSVIALFFLRSLGINLSLAWISILGAMLHILVSGIRDIEEIFEKVEFGTLFFFAALFILMETLKDLGLIDYIAELLTGFVGYIPPGRGRLAVSVLLIIWVSGISSAFIDNIPYTTTLVPVVVTLAESLNLPLTVLVWALVYGTCLGGNGTIIGASANVVCVSLAEKEGHPITFGRFFRFGFPMMLISLVIATIYMLIFHVLIQWY